MADSWWIVGAGVFVTLLALLLVWWPVRAAMRDAHLADVRRDFHLRREWLEVRFVKLAATLVKPGAPQWTECEFDNDVAYVRNRYTGELSAFVGITISLGAALVNPDIDAQFDQFRTGTAVFRFNGQRWETDGRAILNLTPAEAIRFYHDDLEMVAQEMAG